MSVLPEHMRNVVQAYVDGFAEADLDKVVSIYAENATVEDPVGSARHEGMAAIRAFYDGPVRSGTTRLDLHGPVRCAANACSFAFTVTATLDGQVLEIDVIDVFHFDGEGRVFRMQAFWGPSNMRTIENA